MRRELAAEALEGDDGGRLFARRAQVVLELAALERRMLEALEHAAPARVVAVDLRQHLKRGGLAELVVDRRDLALGAHLDHAERGGIAEYVAVTHVAIAEGDDLEAA